MKKKINEYIERGVCKILFQTNLLQLKELFIIRLELYWSYFIEFNFIISII